MKVTAAPRTGESGMRIDSHNVRLDPSYRADSTTITYDPETGQLLHRVVSSRTTRQDLIWPEELNTWLTSR